MADGRPGWVEVGEGEASQDCLCIHMCVGEGVSLDLICLVPGCHLLSLAL